MAKKFDTKAAVRTIIVDGLSGFPAKITLHNAKDMVLLMGIFMRQAHRRAKKAEKRLHAAQAALDAERTNLREITAERDEEIARLQRQLKQTLAMVDELERENAKLNKAGCAVARMYQAQLTALAAKGEAYRALLQASSVLGQPIKVIDGGYALETPFDDGESADEVDDLEHTASLDQLINALLEGFDEIQKWRAEQT